MNKLKLNFLLLVLAGQSFSVGSAGFNPPDRNSTNVVSPTMVGASTNPLDAAGNENQPLGGHGEGQRLPRDTYVVVIGLPGQINTEPSLSARVDSTPGASSSTDPMPEQEQPPTQVQGINTGFLHRAELSRDFHRPGQYEYYIQDLDNSTLTKVTFTEASDMMSRGELVYTYCSVTRESGPEVISYRTACFDRKGYLQVTLGDTNIKLLDLYRDPTCAEYVRCWLGSCLCGLGTLAGSTMTGGATYIVGTRLFDLDQTGAIILSGLLSVPFAVVCGGAISYLICN